MSDDRDEYQGSLFYEQSLQACPWRDTDHLGERRDNYCTWCEGYVAGAEALHKKVLAAMDAFLKVAAAPDPERTEEGT